MKEIKELREMIAALAPFLAIWAVQYQQNYQLDGLHPVHFDLLAKAGARMDGFNRARPMHSTKQRLHHRRRQCGS